MVHLLTDCEPLWAQLFAQYFRFSARLHNSFVATTVPREPGSPRFLQMKQLGLFEYGEEPAWQIAQLRE